MGALALGGRRRGACPQRGGGREARVHGDGSVSHSARPRGPPPHGWMRHRHQSIARSLARARATRVGLRAASGARQSARCARGRDAGGRTRAAQQSAPGGALWRGAPAPPANQQSPGAVWVTPCPVAAVAPPASELGCGQGPLGSRCAAHALRERDYKCPERGGAASHSGAKGGPLLGRW
eukprot:scaffold1903_cov396-Prasinococcus_capsulatus_cf.AAC.25